MVYKYKKKKRAKKSCSSSSSSSHSENKTQTDEMNNEFWLPKIKRRRRFSSREIKILEQEYNENCSPSQRKVSEIADLFSTDRKIITTWFQNRRAKYKKLQLTSTAFEQENQDQGQKDEEHSYKNFDNHLTETTKDYTISSFDEYNTSYYDSDTLNVMNGNTALNTPTFIMHQQEHQYILSTLNSPHYTEKHLYNYFSNPRRDLYYGFDATSPVCAWASTATSTAMSPIPDVCVRPEEEMPLLDNINDSSTTESSFFTTVASKKK